MIFLYFLCHQFYVVILDHHQNVCNVQKAYGKFGTVATEEEEEGTEAILHFEI